jgi:hypothetical protein
MGPIIRIQCPGDLTKEEKRILKFFRKAKEGRLTGLVGFEVVYGKVINVKFIRASEELIFERSTN